MAKVISVACDLHDRTMVVRYAVDKVSGKPMTYAYTRPGRLALIANLKALANKERASRIVFAYEASGLGYRLHDELSEAGIECHVLAPTRLERSPKQRKNKNDHKDAELILDVVKSHVLASKPLPLVHVPDLQQRDDRELVRGRLELTRKRTRLKAQIQSLLKRNGVERPSDLGKSWTKKHAAWLQQLKLGQRLQRGARTVFASLLRQLRCVRQEIEFFDQQLTALSQTERFAEPVQALCKLDGVALLSAMVFLVEMECCERFRNRRQVGSYLGLAPSSDESGEIDNRKGHITRQGPSRIRTVLSQCVWSRIGANAKEKEIYERIRKKNAGRAKVAIVAIMRRLGIRMWHEWKKVHGEAQGRSHARLAPAG